MNMMMTESEEKEILKLCKSKLDSSSLIALPNIYKSKNNIIKLLWFILSISSAGLCSWFMARSISDYLSYNVITKTEMKYNNVMKFPIITICNLNSFATDSANEYIKSIFNTTYPSMSGSILATDLVKMFYNSTTTQEFGKRIDEFMIDCQFGFNQCNLTEDFNHIYDISYGNCYRFNSESNMDGKPSRKKYGNAYNGFLEIELWIGQAKNNYNAFSKDNGYILFINEEISNVINLNGISVSPGYATKIDLEKLTLIKKSKPYSDCLDDLSSIDSYGSLIYKKLFQLSKNEKYQLMSCYSVCIQKYVGDWCGCQSNYLFYIYYDKMRICLANDTLIQQDLECYAKVFDWVIRDANSFTRDCDCPIRCDYSGFSYSSSIAEYPTRQYSAYLMNNSLVKSMLNESVSEMTSLETYETLRKSVARVEISFKDMIETIITEYPKTEPYDLVSNIGGLLGLFLGLSCLSFIELFDLLIQIGFVLMAKKSSSKNTDKSQISQSI